MTSSRPPRPSLRRDRPATSFASLLEGLHHAHDGVLAAVFVDQEGECVDYCSVLDPYDALVAAATWLTVTVQLVGASERIGSGALLQWVFEGVRGDVIARRVTREHALIVLLEAQSVSGRLLSAMNALAEALRKEAGDLTPAWDPEHVPLVVELREAQGWGYAPVQVRQGNTVLVVDDVLGRWTERGAISPVDLVCFRIRSAGSELTLVHDPWLGRWHRR
jgi:predicted regulator of Ras-like GTPase activity (Roadblock/LC7/MglB family)